MYQTQNTHDTLSDRILRSYPKRVNEKSKQEVWVGKHERFTKLENIVSYTVPRAGIIDMFSKCAPLITRVISVRTHRKNVSFIFRSDGLQSKM